MSDNQPNHTKPEVQPVHRPDNYVDQTPEPTTSQAHSNMTPPAQPNFEPVSSIPQIPKPKDRRKFGLAAAIIAAIAVLAGSSAAAYFGVVVPNKPENVLKKAISNTLSQKKTKFDGTISYESTDQKASIKAANLKFTGSYDTDANAFSSVIEATASGLKIPVEVRHVDNSFYFKLGDLSGLKGIVQAAAPTYAPALETLNQKFANQWVEIDQTLLKQVNADCALNSNFSLNQQDIDLLQKRYEKIPFSSVKSTSNDNINGHTAIKYEIEINDNKSAEYFKGVQDLSVVKKLKDCTGKDTGQSSVSPKADNDITPLTLWVDKASKQIVKIASHTTPKDEAKSKAKASFEVLLQYGQASITKPAGAKPFLEVLGDFSQLLGPAFNPGLPANDNSPNAPSSANGVSQECLKAIQDYTNSGGTRPIPTCM